MTRARVRPLVLLAAVACTACVDRLVGADPPQTPAAVFDVVWRDFDRNYALFAVKTVDWNAVYGRYKPMADTVRSLDAVAPVIGAMFAELHDLHVDLKTGRNTRYASIDVSTIHTYSSPGTALIKYVPVTRVSPSQAIRYGHVAPDAAANVGWWIPSFGGAHWADEVDDVLKGLDGSTGLVIDLRNNGGGSTDNSGSIAARFVDQTRDYAYVRYRNGPAHTDLTDYTARRLGPAGHHATGRVVIVINRLCASATEDLLLALRLQPGIVFVGDTTAGALGNPLIRDLPNGWEYRVPQWVEYDANRRAIENIGIAPDVYVPLTRSDSLNGRDPQLLRAIQIAAGGS